MNKLKMILIDGLILFAISTIFVGITEYGFSFLKDDGTKDDPIVTAVIQGKVKVLTKILSSEGVETNLQDSHGRTALMRVAYVNYSTQKRILEADEKRAEMASLLLEHNAPVDTLDSDGWSALMWASWSGMPKVTQELLNAGASVSVVGEQGFTALSLAAMRGKSEAVEELLAKGADSSIKTAKGQTALDLAKQQVAKFAEESEQGKRDAYHKIIDLLE